MITDEEVGANVATLRNARRLSQTEVASSMTKRGWSWAQTTVSAVEKGDRSLKLAEAEDLAQLLAIQVGALTSPSEFNQIMGSVTNLIRLRDDVVEAIDRYERTRITIRSALNEARSQLDSESIRWIEAYVSLTASKVADGQEEAIVDRLVASSGLSRDVVIKNAGY